MLSISVQIDASSIIAVDSEGAGGVRAPSEFGGSEKWRSLISAYWSLAITMNTPGFKKLSMGPHSYIFYQGNFVPMS